LRKLTFLIILFSFLSNVTIFSQNSNYYENLRSKEKKSIKYTNSLIKELEKNKSDVYDKLLVAKSKLEKQKTIINISNREIRLINEEINTEELRLAQLNLELKSLKKEYEKLIYFAYLNNSIQDRMIYVLSAANFNNAYRRIVYLKQLSNYRKTAYNEINKKKEWIDSTIFVLKDKEILKKELLLNIKSEYDSLNLYKKNIQKEFNKLDFKIDELNKQLVKNNKQKITLKTKVKKEIKETKTATTYKRNNKSYKINSSVGVNFAKYKRHHLWPLSNYVILHNFGDYHHPVLRDIIVKNDGIVLGSKSGVNVYCIFSGQVINVIDIPGNGTSIIIKHGKFYSVYSNVYNIEVKAGQIVKKGQQIARLSKNKKLAKMTFQLWNGKTKLNPRLWLKK